MGNTATATHDFKMHPGLLRSVIRKQAGSLDKALLEGAMNSIDAGSTRVDITIEALRVTIRDDGRGFTNADEVRDFFATFGTPHDDGDATYGRFRMGRGQMFAFGCNSWRTGEFQMDVDIDKHLGFELETDLPEQKGCQIEIKLYDPLSQSDIHACIRAISKMVKYTPVPVFVNGERVSIDIDPKKFPGTTEDAYIKTEAASYGGLDVYNLGVFVCTMPAWKFGVSGIVVSRKQLDVNFARNEILGTCPVWRRVKPIVDNSGRNEVKRKAALTEDEQENIIDRLVTKDMRLDESDGLRFLRDVTGKAWSPKQIRSGRFEAYSVAQRGDSHGDKLMQMGKAIVFDADCIERFECKPEELFVKFAFRGMPVFDTMQNLTVGLSSNHAILPKKQWKPTERAWVSIIQRMQYYLSTGFYDHTNGRYVQNYKARRIDVGTSDVANGWTDGKTYIAFSRGYISRLNMFKNGVPSVKSFMAIAELLIHEACHDTDSRENVHSPDFYREFHDLTFSKMGAMVSDAMNYMTPAKYKKIVGGIEDTEPEPEFESGD